jgi:hypothetical protein
MKYHEGVPSAVGASWVIHVGLSSLGPFKHARLMEMMTTSEGHSGVVLAIAAHADNALRFLVRHLLAVFGDYIGRLLTFYRQLQSACVEMEVVEATPVTAVTAVTTATAFKGKPGDVYDSHHALERTVGELARIDNFSLTDDKREKKRGTGLWRGKFRCSGSNTKEQHRKKQKPLYACPFCVPYTYIADDGSVVIKEFCLIDSPDGSGARVQQEFCLEHNHVMHGVMTVVSAMGEMVTVKSMDQQLTDRERAFVGMFAGTHVSVAEIQVTVC